MRAAVAARGAVLGGSKSFLGRTLRPDQLADALKRGGGEGLAVGPVGVGAEHGVERAHEKGRAYADALAAGAADEQEGLLAVGVYDD